MLSLKNLIVGIFLFVQGCLDLKRKEIPTCLSVIGGSIGCILSIIEGRSIFDMAYAWVPGILCLFFAKISKQAIGYGDGILLCSLACMYSMEKLLCICMIASIFGGTTAFVLLIFFHKKGNYEMPFVPFLFLGWIVECFIIGGI